MIDRPPVLDLMIDATLGILALAILLCLLRVVRGPTLPDRVVALDLVGVLMAAVAVVMAADTGAAFFLDVAIVIALISFIGTVAYGRYIETRERF